MEDIWSVLGLAAALVLVIEGALYALFPGFMQRIMAEALNMTPDTLRQAGMTAFLIGAGVVWLLVS